MKMCNEAHLLVNLFKERTMKMIDTVDEKCKDESPEWRAGAKKGLHTAKSIISEIVNDLNKEGICS